VSFSKGGKNKEQQSIGSEKKAARKLISVKEVNEQDRDSLLFSFFFKYLYYIHLA
jgi:hypothetical protein